MININKKGSSLVELIAVIVIMGIIAAIAIPTTVVLINRQRKNAVINSLNEIYASTRGLLIQVETTSYDPNITLVDDDFCYISLTTLIDSGNVDGSTYKPIGDEIYFCYNMHDSWVVITSGDIAKTKPTSTGSTTVNQVIVTFNFETDKFKTA